ncbi:MAG: hypothetical protein V3T30_07470 [Thermodesulfobacteriota bacterium]
MKRKSFLFILIVLLMTFGCSAGDEPRSEPKKEVKSELKSAVKSAAKTADPVADLLARMIEEYGGEENLKKLDSYISVWDIQVMVRDDKGTATNHVELPGKLKVELVYPDKKEARVLNSGKGYKTYNGSAGKPAVGPPLDAMKLQLLRLFTPLTLSRLFTASPGSFNLSEDGEYKLLTLKGGNLGTIYYVNAKTLMIEKVVGRLSMGGQTMEFLTEYSDIRPEGGVLMHHMENKFAGGTNTAKLYLKEIKLGATIDGKVFE